MSIYFLDEGCGVGKGGGGGVGTLCMSLISIDFIWLLSSMIVDVKD